MLSQRDRSLIDALQIAYVRALDLKDMSGWVECFDQNVGGYECITEDNDRDGLVLPLMLDDCPGRLRDRVTFINDVWSGTFTDYGTRHFLQSIEIVQAAEGQFRGITNFMVAFTTPERQSGILVAGRYEDEIDCSGEKAVFIKRRAILDTTTTPRYLVYPV